MPEKSEKRFFYRDYEAVSVDGPDNEDILVINSKKDMFLTELTIDAVNASNIQVHLREEGSTTNDNLVASITETNFSDGEFENPVAEASIDQEIAIIATGTITGEVNVNTRTHKRKN